MAGIVPYPFVSVGCAVVIALASAGCARSRVRPPDELGPSADAGHILDAAPTAPPGPMSPHARDASTTDDAGNPAVPPRDASTSQDAAAQGDAAADATDAALEPDAARPLACDEGDAVAIDMADPALIAWASSVIDVVFGEGSEQPRHMRADDALGPAQGGAGVVSLGDRGVITLGFEPPIANGEGWDLAVFENAFDDAFLELAFVEVSSDGATFARFPSAFEGEGPSHPSYAGRAEVICGLAGQYRAGWGTPFDLEQLAAHAAVLEGALDLDAVRYVRIADIVGDGSERDSLGRPIYDPFPTRLTVGFDLDGVGARYLGEP